MRRTPLTFAPILSLLLCVAVCALWVRSYFGPIVQRFHYRGELWEAALTNGRLRVNNAPSVVADVVRHMRGRSGGAASTTPVNLRVRSWTSPAAGPLLVLLLAVPPAIAFKRRRDVRRRCTQRRCPVCGYDLRATPDRCPECGAAGKTEAAT